MFPSRGSSRPRDQTQSLMSPPLAGGFFITSATWEAPFMCTCNAILFSCGAITNYHRLSGLRSFPGGSNSKESGCNAGDLGLIPGLEKFPGEGNGGLRPWDCKESDTT